MATGAVATSSPGAMRTNEASSAGEVAGPPSTASPSERSKGSTPVATAWWRSAGNSSIGSLGMWPDPTGLAARVYSK